MTDHPMPFSAPMVRAALEGRKVQTRRVVKKQAALDALAVFGPRFLMRPGNADLVPVHIGDRIWVRETWRGVVAINPPWAPDEYGIARYVPEREHCRRIEYKATQAPDDEPFRPSIHMPRWASRLTLVVTDVRAQRLQDISEDDARAEGAERLICDDDCRFYQSSAGTYRTGFAGIWTHIAGPDDWDANPWVWALTFEVNRRNIDEVAT